MRRPALRPALRSASWHALWLTALLLGLGSLATAQAPMSIQASTSATTIEFGRAFDVIVRRCYPIDLEPTAWDSTQLEPLNVSRVSSEKSTEGAVTTETIRLQARAFATGPLTTVVPSIRAIDNAGEEIVASGEPLTIVVTSSLGDPAGGVELPAEHQGASPARGRWLAYLFGGLIALGAMLTLRWHRSRQPTPRPEVHHTLTRTTIARVHELRADPGPDSAAATAELLRDYLRLRFGMPTRELSTEEILTLLDGHHDASEPSRRLVSDVLHGCDRFKFGAEPPHPAETVTLLNDLERVVTTTSPSPATSGAV